MHLIDNPRFDRFYQSLGTQEERAREKEESIYFYLLHIFTHAIEANGGDISRYLPALQGEPSEYGKLHELCQLAHSELGYQGQLGNVVLDLAPRAGIQRHFTVVGDLYEDISQRQEVLDDLSGEYGIDSRFVQRVRALENTQDLVEVRKEIQTFEGPEEGKKHLLHYTDTAESLFVLQQILYAQKGLLHQRLEGRGLFEFRDALQSTYNLWD
jgi:hypothetical protein